MTFDPTTYFAHSANYAGRWEALIITMTADPEPNESVFHLCGQGTAIPADSH